MLCNNPLYKPTIATDKSVTMETLKEELAEEIRRGKYKSKPQVIVAQKFADEFFEVAAGRGWLKPELQKFSTKCNHQEHRGFVDRNHVHIIIDLGKTSRAAYQKYMMRKLSVGKEKRFRTVYPKSMNHHICQMLYLMTDKHGHENKTLKPKEAKEIADELRSEFPALKRQKEKEDKLFQTRVRMARERMKLKKIVSYVNNKKIRPPADTDTEDETDGKYNEELDMM